MIAEENESPVYLEYVREITQAYAEDIEQDLGLIYCGCGGSMPYTVNAIEVLFESNRKATIEEARKLEVTCTEKLIAAVNSHEKIRPFLTEYPFTPNRAKVSISFNKKSEAPYKDSVCHVFQVKNTIFYKAENPKDKNLYLSLREEPYEEALNLVKQSKKKS